jgi:hypothetical protein
MEKDYLKIYNSLIADVDDESVIDDGIDIIYNFIDDLCLEGDFLTVDKFLSICQPEKLGITYSIAVLSITNAAKDILKERKSFFDKTKEYFILVDPERVDRLLSGFE